MNGADLLEPLNTKGKPFGRVVKNKELVRHSRASLFSPKCSNRHVGRPKWSPRMMPLTPLKHVAFRKKRIRELAKSQQVPVIEVFKAFHDERVLKLLKLLLWIDVPKELSCKRRMHNKNCTEDYFNEFIWANHTIYHAESRGQLLPDSWCLLQGSFFVTKWIHSSITGWYMVDPAPGEFPCFTLYEKSENHVNASQNAGGGAISQKQTPAGFKWTQSFEWVVTKQKLKSQRL